MKSPEGVTCRRGVDCTQGARWARVEGTVDDIDPVDSRQRTGEQRPEEASYPALGNFCQSEDWPHQLHAARLDAAGQQRQHGEIDIDPVGTEPRTGTDLDPVAHHGPLDGDPGARQNLELYGTFEAQVGAGCLPQHPRELLTQIRDFDELWPRHEERDGEADQQPGEDENATHANPIQPPE